MAVTNHSGCQWLPICDPTSHHKPVCSPTHLGGPTNPKSEPQSSSLQIRLVSEEMTCPHYPGLAVLQIYPPPSMSTCHLYSPYSHLSLPQNASPTEPCPYDLGFLHSSHLRATHAVPSIQSALPQDCLGPPVRARLKSHLLQEALPDQFSSTKLPYLSPSHQ